MQPLFSLTLLAFISAYSVLAQSSAQQDGIFHSRDAVESSIKSVPCDRDLRLTGVKKLFASVGASESDITIESLDKNKISNLVVRKKGETDETIVLGAHYDRAEIGCGVTDNWSGVTILAHVYGTLRPLKTKKSYMFVAFDEEEKGLRGSSQMLKAMTGTQIERICSMVNFDSFGQGYPMALQNASSPKLLKLAEALGKESGFKFNSVEMLATSDSASFRDKKVPAITLSGLAINWTEILHSSSDKLDKINFDSVYLGYRFGVLFIAKLEAAGCREFK